MTLEGLLLAQYAQTVRRGTQLPLVQTTKEFFA